MTRKPAPADQVEDDVGAPGEGDNSQAETEMIRLHARRIISANEAVDAANKARSRLRKEAKADGIGLGALDKMIHLLGLSPDEQRVYFHEQHTYAEALHIAHVAIGQQLDILDHSPDPEVRKRDIYARGFAAATTGKGVFGVVPDYISPEDGQEWLRGWGDGQAKNAPSQLVEPETEDA